MRRVDLAKPFYGVRVPRHGDAAAESLVTVYSKRMSPHHFFSHVTAAVIHGLPLPLTLQRSPMLHVCTEDPSARHGSRTVVGHHCRPGSIRVVDVAGLRVASPVDTWCQLSTVLSVDELVMVGDALVRRVKPLASMEELRVAVARFAGHRGARRLRAALEWVRPGTDSPKETELRVLLIRAGLPEPEVNGIIVDRFGVKVATGDLVYRRYRVLVEYDGAQHREDEEQYHWDVDRLDDIMAEDWRVIRINKSHLGGRTPVAIRKVEAALRARGWRPRT